MITLQIAAANATPVLETYDIIFEGCWYSHETEMFDRGISTFVVKSLYRSGEIFFAGWSASSIHGGLEALS
jgi:hypothetical protein